MPVNLSTLGLMRVGTYAAQASLPLLGTIVAGKVLAEAASPILGAIGDVATNMEAGILGDELRNRFEHRSFILSDELNHDIQKALTRAFQGAMTQIEISWKQQIGYNALKKSEKTQYESGIKQLQRLHELRDLYANDPTQVGPLPSDAADQLSQGNATAEHFLSTYLLPVYIQGNDDLLRFVQERLADEWVFRFDQILKENSEEGTAAWRAYQRMWQANLVTMIQEMQQESSRAQLEYAASLQSIEEWLNGWGERLKQEIPDETENAVRAALDETLAPISQKIDGWGRQLPEDIRRLQTVLINELHQQRTLIEQLLSQQAIEPAALEEARKEFEEHAHSLLATLPTDTIPEPVTNLPSGSRVLHRRNDLFVGRTSTLMELARSLKEGATTVVMGMGGLGKTQLAVEFVHRYGQFFAGGVFWLSFADTDNVRHEVAECGDEEHMKLDPNFSDLPLAKQVKLVRAEWNKNLPRLLIFDNCEDEALLEEWRPPMGACRVLLTSRRADWPLRLNVHSHSARGLTTR